MPSEISRPWAYVGLGAAAVFATGSVIAATIVGDQRRAAAEAASGTVSELQSRFAAATAAIDVWESQNAQAQCELDARVVTSVQLETRMEAALVDAEIVDDAYLIIEPGPRTAFEQSRIATIEAFAAGFTTDEDAAVAAEYEGVADVLAACLADMPEGTSPTAAPVTRAEVERAEARAAQLGSPAALDTARFDQLDQAVADLTPAVLAAADAVVGVPRLAATADALTAAVAPLRAQPAPSQTIDALDALTTHARAALDRQAAIAAEQNTAPTPVQQGTNPAPRPPSPLPDPTPAPVPTETANPAPTVPSDDGDSPILPEVP